MTQWRVRIAGWNTIVRAASRRQAVIVAVEQAIRQHQAGHWPTGAPVLVSPVTPPRAAR